MILTHVYYIFLNVEWNLGFEQNAELLRRLQEHEQIEQIIHMDSEVA